MEPDESDRYEEDKTAAKARRMELCRRLDDVALVVFPAANMLFNIVYWAVFLS